MAADEAFLTSTLMEIMPVTNCKIENKNGEMDTKVIKKGEVGPVTRVLQTAYRDLLDMS